MVGRSSGTAESCGGARRHRLHQCVERMGRGCASGAGQLLGEGIPRSHAGGPAGSLRRGSGHLGTPRARSSAAGGQRGPLSRPVRAIRGAATRGEQHPVVCGSPGPRAEGALRVEAGVGAPRSRSDRGDERVAGRPARTAVGPLAGPRRTRRAIDGLADRPDGGPGSHGLGVVDVDGDDEASVAEQLDGVDPDEPDEDDENDEDDEDDEEAIPARAKDDLRRDEGFDDPPGESMPLWMLDVHTSD